MKKTKDLGMDAEGIKKTMRKSDYLADMCGQFGLGMVGNLVGQLTYFYTDKVGLAVGMIGIVMAISKIIDAVTDIWFVNIIEHSKGGNKKYFRWMISLAFPIAITIVMLFTVPVSAGQGPALAYVLITNLLLSAVCATLIGTPFAAVQVVRTRSQEERGTMGILRAVGSYGSGMFAVIATIPITNALGGNQNAWIKYGFMIALIVLLSLLICWNNGHKAEFVNNEVSAKDQEEEKIPLKETMHLLFTNKYWVIVLLFNLITSVTNAISGQSAAYYTKWIFGNDNLTALLGGLGFGATIIGFIISKPLIQKFGTTNTIKAGLLGAAISAGLRCIAPSNIVWFCIFSMTGSLIQIPMMCLYGVILAMAVDYNEWKYGRNLVSVSSGAIGFGNKVGSGIGTVVLSVFMVIGSYDATLSAATESMKMSIYGFTNYAPLVINLLMYFIFRGFDIEKKLPQIQKDLQKRREASTN